MSIAINSVDAAAVLAAIRRGYLYAVDALGNEIPDSRVSTANCTSLPAYRRKWGALALQYDERQIRHSTATEK
jgi:hypothetical protein